MSSALHAKRSVNMFRQDTPNMVCRSKRLPFACFSNNKNAWQVGISLRHSILYKEMLVCKTPVIDLLTATMDRITI
jgi:hypothetical protein